MAVNIWNRGSDALLQGLAEREMRQRQEALDAERIRQAQADEAYRASNLALQTRQLEENSAARLRDDDRLAADSAARRQALESAGKKSVREEEQKAALIQMYQAAQDPADKQRIAMNLSMMGVDVPQTTQRAETRSLEVQAAEALAAGDTARYQNLLRVQREMSGAGRAPETGGGGAAPFRDNPRLPQGTKQWIDSIAQRVRTGSDGSEATALRKAREELSQGWGQQRAAHPNAELAEAAKYLDTLYQEGMPIFSASEGALPAQPAAPQSTVGGSAVPMLDPAGAPLLVPPDQVEAALAAGATLASAPRPQPATPRRTGPISPVSGRNR